MSTLNFIVVAPLPLADLDPICAKKHLPSANSRIYVDIQEIVIPAAAKRGVGIHTPLTPRVSRFSAGLSGNRNGLLCIARNQLKVVMRGLDPRIHTVAGAASARREDRDGRIKSG
ncbi:MAG TPA: hypothetical protein VHT00_12110, partial [Stellaceae bacterium]|nr:hypothetical protein [Stellaceae bacterium]